jgi:bacillopeptidase F (M6 metalloprotease family)
VSCPRPTPPGSSRENHDEQQVRARADRKTGKITKRADDAIAQAYAVDAKHAKGNPVTARQLAKLEAKAQKTGQSPMVITLADPHSGSGMWYSGAGQSWADVKLRRTIDVPDAADAKFWVWNNYVTEEDWDFGFIEVSTDGGTTWTEQKVYDEAGTLVSTDDGYADPNGRMHDYGDKKYGLHGDSHGWRHDYVDLSAYASQTVQLRLRYATDAGFEERGWFTGDFSVTGGGSTTWSDDAEGADNAGLTSTTRRVRSCGTATRRTATSTAPERPRRRCRAPAPRAGS